MLVSVIIPTCNSPFTLNLAVKSVLDQIGDSGEIIIVNDGKRPLSKVWNIIDPRITVREDFVRSIEELSYPSGGYTRNFGLQIARGKYIAFLDDDDQFEPNKLMDQLKQMERNDWEISCTDAYISIFPFRKLIKRKVFSEFYKEEISRHLRALNLIEIPKQINEFHLNEHNFIITSSVICQSSAVREVGNFNNIKSQGQLINGKIEFEDWNLWKRLSKKYIFHYIDKPMVHYKRGSINKIGRRLKKILNRLGMR